MENIKVKNAHIEILGSGALQGFMRKEIPARLAYHLARVIKKLEVELKALAETRQAIIKKYAELDEKGEVKTEKDGRTIIWKDGKTSQDVAKEMDEILEDEVELEIQKMEIDLDEIPLVALSDMTLLEPFIEAK